MSAVAKTIIGAVLGGLAGALIGIVIEWFFILPFLIMGPGHSGSLINADTLESWLYTLAPILIGIVMGGLLGGKIGFSLSK